MPQTARLSALPAQKDHNLAAGRTFYLMFLSRLGSHLHSILEFVPCAFIVADIQHAVSSQSVSETGGPDGEAYGGYVFL
jgi:hypothetical protein